MKNVLVNVKWNVILPDFVADTMGDWKIYPSGVKLIAQGKVAVDGRRVVVEGKELPVYGIRLDGL